MPRRRATFVSGEFYHLYNRGALQAPLFYDDYSYRLFLEIAYSKASALGVTIVAFCLMPNHFHFLIRVEPGGNVQEWIKALCQIFSLKINRRYHRSGTSFQNRFQSVHIDKQQYLQQVCRYIHANPVVAGISRSAEMWQYSDYSEWIGQRQFYKIDREFVQSQFPSAAQYKQFVEELVQKRTLKQKVFAEGLQKMHLLPGT